MAEALDRGRRRLRLPMTGEGGPLCTRRAAVCESPPSFLGFFWHLFLSSLSWIPTPSQMRPWRTPRASRLFGGLRGLPSCHLLSVTRGDTSTMPSEGRLPVFSGFMVTLCTG